VTVAGRDPVVPARGGRRARPARWVAVCVLALVAASDYKLRVRPYDRTISGYPDPNVLLEIGIYAAVAVFLLLRLDGPPRARRTSTLTFLAGAYVMVMVVGATYSPYPMLATVRALQMLVVLALSLSIARRADRAALHALAHAFAVLVAGSVVLGVVLPLPRFRQQQDRFTWLHLHPVVAGVFLGLAVVILVGYVLSEAPDRPGPRWPRPVYLCLLALTVAGLVATKTRGAALGAILGCLVVAWSTRRGRQRVDFAALAVAGGVAVALAATSAVGAFFARGEDADKLATLNSRTDLWSAAWDLFQDRPLYGYGLGASRGLFLDTLGLGGGHNALVNVLVDLGLLGAAIWLALVIGIVATAVRVPALASGAAADRAQLLGLMAFLIVDSVFVEGLGAAANVASMWMFVVIAWLEVLRRGEVLAPARPAPLLHLPPPTLLARRSERRR
jgi:exopolysaccharide production protein ExoQ